MQKEAEKKFARIQEIVEERSALDAELEGILMAGGGAEKTAERTTKPEPVRIGKGRRLTPEEKDQIIERHQDDERVPDIARHFGVSDATVYAVIKKATATKGRNTGREKDEEADRPDEDAAPKEDDLEKVKSNIIRMHRNGNSELSISKMLHISRYEVKEILDAAIEAGEVEEDPGEDGDESL